MLYNAYEMTQAAISPMHATARFVQAGMQSPNNPMAAFCRPSHTSAALEIFLDATRRYAKPEFGLSSTLVDGVDTPVVEEVVWAKPFCRLLHFRRMLPASRVGDPKVLIVAPMSGHFATLLRGTVEAMLPEHDVFITDWTDARNVPLRAGRFDLDDYTDYLIEMMELIAAGSPGSESPTTLGSESLHVRALGTAGRVRTDRGLGRLPARHPGDGRRQPDGRGQQPSTSFGAGPDGVTDRHGLQPEAAQRIRAENATRKLRAQRYHASAMAVPGLRAAGLPRLSAALELPGNESRPTPELASRAL